MLLLSIVSAPTGTKCKHNALDALECFNHCVWGVHFRQNLDLRFSCMGFHYIFSLHENNTVSYICRLQYANMHT